MFFPSPIRKQEVKKLRDKAWPILKRNLRFPIPEGTAWEAFVNEKCGLLDHHGENIEAAKYLTELEYHGVQCEVYLDYNVYKMLQKGDDETNELLLEQISLAELAESVDKNVNHAKLEEAQYYDEKGLPIAPKSVKQLLKRAACKNEWFEAIKKEHKGLDDRGVMKYMTLKDAIKHGHVSWLYG